jgi:hypothetical protein
LASRRWNGIDGMDGKESMEWNKTGERENTASSKWNRTNGNYAYKMKNLKRVFYQFLLVASF